jgi:hypothetical protein
MRFSSKAKIVIALVVLSVLLLVIGCGSSSSPSTVAEDFVRAVADQDCSRIVPLLSDESKALFEQEGQDAEAGCEAAIGGDTVGQDIVINNLEITNETEDGDSAQVDIKMSYSVGDEEQTTEDNVKLVKQNGDWKVAVH